MREYILAINPGSTSTKIGIFKEKDLIEITKIEHSLSDLEVYKHINDQLDFRLKCIINFLWKKYNLQMFKAIVGRGGLVKPIPSGTYLVCERMLQDLHNCLNGEHASNLGGQLASIIANLAGANAYIVDPVVVDEMEEIARVSGLPEIERKPKFHALNIRAVALKAAEENSFRLEDENIIVIHLGAGFSGCAMRKGIMVDVINGLEEGGFSPERTGSLPILELIKLAYSGKYSHDELNKKLVGGGGLVAYFGTNDCRQVLAMRSAGDKKAEFMLDAMTYQISKEIGALATVLEGKVKCIILTGGVAYDLRITSSIAKRVEFIAPVFVKPGEDELKALNEGVLRVLSGIEKVKNYEEEAYESPIRRAFNDK